MAPPKLSLRDEEEGWEPIDDEGWEPIEQQSDADVAGGPVTGRARAAFKGAANSIGLDYSKSSAAVEHPTLGPEYEKRQAEYSKAQDAAEREYPGANFLGGVAATAALPAALPFQMISGGLSGYGNSKAESVGGKLRDAAIGAGTAGVLGRGLRALPRIGGWLRGVGEDLAFGAAGGSKKHATNLIAEEGPDAARNLGRFILDEGYIEPGRAFTARGNAQSIAQNATAAQRGYGQMQGRALSELDELAPQAIDPKELAGRLEQNLIDPMLDAPAERRFLPAVRRELREISDTPVHDAPLGRMNFTQAEERLKRPYQATAKYGKVITSLPEQKSRDLASGIRGFLEEKAAPVSQAADDFARGQGMPEPQILARYLRGKEGFGNAKEVRALTSDKVAKEIGNRPLSLTDDMAGMAGVASGGLSGGAFALGHKILRERGGAPAALTADSLGSALQNSQGAVGGMSRDALRQLIIELMTSNASE